MHEPVTVKRYCQNIPTYIPQNPIELPMFFENKPYQGASGRLYPLPYSDGISGEKEDVAYDMYTVENEYIQVDVLPRFGGKIQRGYDKMGKCDFLYHNQVVKPALVGLAGAWISGGIEFNWPQHHRPTTYMPLEAATEECPSGAKTVWTGEVEPFYRMKGMVGITLEPHRSYVKAKVCLYNRTALPQIFMWWANLAVPVNESYRTIFPPDVEWVNDHDRRAIIEWPIAKGVYKTARPFNYGDGTDLSRYDAVKVPSSFLVSQGQSDMDFVAGYDAINDMGIVTVADHHISPGKKMWTWGHGEFGDMWCSNLTDEDGPYIELMTGVYTDNQPDFTWMAPYESREFEQYWYPIRGIGDVKNATIDAAMNMEKRGDELVMGFHVTGVFPEATVLVKDGADILFEETCDLSPKEAYKKTLSLQGHVFENITVSLVSKEGKTLVAYTPYVRGQKQPIEVRKPVVRPGEIKSIEELYINGLHLEQYKQHNYDPKDYYREALRRDANDIRCNTAMGRLALKNGEFETCVFHCDTAIRRLTLRNQHPSDTEALYLKGVALCYLKRYQEAYDSLARAAWNYAHRGAAHYQMAVIDCRNLQYVTALEKLDISLGLSEGHRNAINLKTAILRKTGHAEEAEKRAYAAVLDDRLDLWSKMEKNNFVDISAEIIAQFASKPENFLDVVCSYMEAGLYEDALKTLKLAGDSYPLFSYYRARCKSLLGLSPADDLRAAAACDTGYCFPARLEDIDVLQYAIQTNNKDANAPYYLGCLYYDRFRYEEATSCWEQSVYRNPQHARAHRNLSLVYFDKRGDFFSAKQSMEQALERLAEPRLLLEYQQMLKNINTPPTERLAVYDAWPALLARRDDCYLDRIVLLCLLGKHKEAIDAAVARHFHIYEGGEGKLTKQHAWMHVLYANELAAAGHTDQAEKTYKNGIDMPKSYGEAKTWFNQEAHIYYYLGLLKETQGKKEEAATAFEQASADKSTVSELSMFRALALRKRGCCTQAANVLEEMLTQGNRLIENSDLRSYYGVGSPSPMPFEYNIEKQNLVDGHILKGYALLGLGRRTEATQQIEAAAAIDPYHFQVYAFRQIVDTV